MRVEVNLVALEHQENRTKKSRRRQRKTMPSIVQQLFDVCNEVFSGITGTVPSEEDIERLKLVLDRMTLKDVGLRENMPHFKRAMQGVSPVTYLHIYENSKFSIGIFCLPSLTVIPLHNHPRMTVLSKLLWGSMHIKSYDWVDDDSSMNDNPNPSHCFRLAKMKADAILTAPCNTSVLYPTSGGNMHCFTAQTPCALLDVLGPPYSDTENRHCTYYKEFPYSKFSGEMDRSMLDSCQDDEGFYAWLGEREKPKSFSVIGADYQGPRI